MRLGLWLAAGVTALAAIVAIAAILVLDPFSGGSDDGNAGESSLQKTLRKMVLQPGDVPEGLELGEESFLTNDDTASKEPDPEARRQLLDQWGRLLGFEIAYRPAEGEVVDSVRGINASSSLYETEEGAGESFADAVKTAEEKDWARDYAGLREFEQERIKSEGLADEIVWLRLSGIQPGTSGPDALVTDDLIFFRIGTERGFLRVLGSTTETEDRTHLHPTVESWLRTLVGNVRAALPDSGAEDGG